MLHAEDLVKAVGLDGGGGGDGVGSEYRLAAGWVDEDVVETREGTGCGDAIGGGNFGGVARGSLGSIRGVVTAADVDTQRGAYFTVVAEVGRESVTDGLDTGFNGAVDGCHDLREMVGGEVSWQRAGLRPGDGRR